MCPSAPVPEIRTLIPFVVRHPLVPKSIGAADRFAVVWSFPKDAPTSLTVSTRIVALTPLPFVVVAYVLPAV